MTVASLRGHVRDLVALTGDKELIAKFDDLVKRQVPKRVRWIVNRGVKEMASAIKSAIPAAKTKGHSSKGLKSNVGGRLKKSRRSGQYEGVAGQSVGKRKNAKRGKTQPHYHLFALGTRPRYNGHKTHRNSAGPVRKRTGSKIAYRGIMPSNDFVGRAYAARGSSILGKMVEDLRLTIEFEMSKN